MSTAARSRVSPRAGPYAWLAGTLAASGGTAALILGGRIREAGAATLVAAVLLLAARASARRTGDRRADFAVRILDRLLDASVLAPLAWVARIADPRVAVLALAGLGAAYVAAYERARGTALGFRVREPAGYRALLSLVLAVGLLGRWIEAGLWIFCAVAIAATAVRAWTVAVQFRVSKAHVVTGE